MNNITIDDDDPTLPQVNVEDIDIYHIAINVLVAHERTGKLLQSLLGNSVTLTTKKGRSWHPENLNLMILVWNPFIILTVLSNVVKENLCCFFTDHGHVVLPSGEEGKHVITNQRIRCFRHKKIPLPLPHETCPTYPSRHYG